MPTRSGWLKGVAAFFLIGFALTILFFVYTNINQPDQTYSFSVPLIYPAPIGQEMTFGPETIAVNITISYTNVLVERQPVTIEAYGTIGGALVPTVEYVGIGFEGALPYSSGTHLATWNPAFNGVTMSIGKNDTTDMPYYLGYDLVRDKNVITFPLQGDYYPVLAIYPYPEVELKSNMTIRPTLYGFQDFKLHVSASEVIRQTQTDNANVVLAYALFALAFIEIVVLLASLVPKKWLGSKEEEKMDAMIKLLLKRLGEEERKPKQDSTQNQQGNSAEDKPKRKHLPPWRNK